MSNDETGLPCSARDVVLDYLEAMADAAEEIGAFTLTRGGVHHQRIRQLLAATGRRGSRTHEPDETHR